MSLKCSVLGHDFGNPEVERDREEQGSEVVITITETETCSRCGKQRVVSENKEVTTLETPSDIVGDDLEEDGEGDDEETDEEPTAQETEADVTAGEGGAEVTTTDRQTEVETGVEPTPDATGEVTVPDAETGAPATEHAPDASEDDAVILDDDEDEDDEDDERAPGEWPDEEDDDDPDWAPETERDLGPDESDTDIESTASAVTVPEGTFYCSECDFSTPVEDSSLREGDFCPECHRGSLEHRAE